MNFLAEITGFDCGGADILRILKFVFILLDIVCFVVPMVLIVMVIVDLGKNVIAGKEDEMKKNLNITIKRVIYCMVIFLIPTIATFAIKLVGDVVPGDKDIADKASECIRIAKEEDLSQYEVDYEEYFKTNTDNNKDNK